MTELKFKTSAPVVRVDPPQPKVPSHVVIARVLDNGEERNHGVELWAKDGSRLTFDMRLWDDGHGSPEGASEDIGKALAEFLRIPLERKNMTIYEFDNGV